MSITILKHRSALLRALGLVVAAALLALAAFAAYAVRAPLPKTDGTLRVGGLRAEAIIRRDERGIPHISARSDYDAYFAEGFACAQDRLWQMDTLRRRAEGTLSEVVGPVTIELDRYVRTLGLAASSRSDYARLRPRERALLVAYAAGVNAAALTHPLPLEFRLLGYRPAPWSPIDSIAVGKLMAQRLDDQWYIPKLRAALRERLGDAAADALTDEQVPALEEYIPGFGPGKAAKIPNFVRNATFSGAKAPALQALGSFSGEDLWREPDAGSNNWVVGPGRTTTGKPVLSNDTHLAHSLPSTWWIAQVQAPGLDVEGFTIPGVPGIVVGHNERIAFGVTSSVENVQDLFVERFRSATSDEYLANGAWRKAQHRVERIAIKGRPAVDMDVLVTRHGPIVERDGSRALALSWTILQNGGESDVVDRLDRASNWREFRSALSHWVGPNLNFGYADVDGHIGYQDAGVVPVRASGVGFYPVEGQDDRFAWRGYVPFESLPNAVDPPGGVLATANQQLAAGAFGQTLSTFWESPYRVHRIIELLRGAPRMSPLQVGAVQSDVYDRARARLALETARLLSASSDPALRRVGAQLQAWDGRVTATSRAPTFLYEEERWLTDDVLASKLSSGTLETYTKHFHAIIVLERVLDGDRRLAKAGVTRESVRSALLRAAAKAARMLHADGPRGIEALEAWGEHNAARYDHPLAQSWPLNLVLSARPQVQPGDVFAVYAGRPAYGPSQRLVVDLANWDNSSMLLTLGESGHFSDEHYLDQLADFTAVRWAPTPFTPHAVAAATQHTLHLLPQ